MSEASWWLWLAVLAGHGAWSALNLWLWRRAARARAEVLRLNAEWRTEVRRLTTEDGG